MESLKTRVLTKGDLETLLIQNYVVEFDASIGGIFQSLIYSLGLHLIK